MLGEPGLAPNAFAAAHGRAYLLHEVRLDIPRRAP